MKTAYLNPYGQSALEIIHEYGNINQITNTTEEINNIIKNTQNQEPRRVNTIRELCFEKIRQYYNDQAKQKTNKYNYIFTPSIDNVDTIATHTLLQTITINYGSTSTEAEMITRIITNTTRRRIEKNTDEELIDNTLSDYLDTRNTTLNDILPLIKDEDIKLHNILLNKNRVILTYDDFINEYSEYLAHRNSRTIYSLLSSKMKKDIITALICRQTRTYMKKIEEKLKQVEPAPLIKELGKQIRNIGQEEKEKSIQTRRGPRNKYTNFNDDQPTPYLAEAFPPCAKKALKGIQSGGRNYAISLFLTPFMSYARLYPGVYAKHIKKPRITDFDPTLEITQNEILPLIEKAAERCKPPLFKDQPQEKNNIHNKLGFGEDQIKAENAGKSYWYTPPNCKNIKQAQPSLCTPCADCQKIGNPLIYYNRKRKITVRKEKKRC